MALAHTHNLTIDRSVLYNIEGDYHYNITAPGERVIILLCACGLNPLNRQQVSLNCSKPLAPAHSTIRKHATRRLDAFQVHV